MRSLPAAAPELPEQVRDLLRRRAERTRSRSADAQEEKTGAFAEFALGRERLILPLRQLVAALPLGIVTPVPLAPPEVLGVFRHRGELLTAFSLAGLLGVRGWNEDPSVLLVVDAGDGRRVAVDCEQIPKAEELPLAPIEAAQESGSGALVPVLVGGRALSILDLARLFAPRGGGR